MMKFSYISLQRGSSLLEVLIAVLIMSFGMLALGNLTVASLQYGKLSQFQTISVQLAADLTDRMRANIVGFGSSAYNKTTVYTSSNAVIATPSPACNSGAPCTAAQLAALDLVQWRNDLRSRLPGGDAYVVRSTTNSSAVDVWIMWTESSQDVGLSTLNNTDCPAAAVVSVSPLPRCVYFRVNI